MASLGNVTIPSSTTVGLGGVPSTAYVITAGAGGGGGNWTTYAGSTNSVWGSASPKVNITDGDIVLDGVSLRDTLKGLQERLAIMVPHPKLEKEFEQLKALRDQYNALAKECEEKLKAWEVLKKDNE